MKWGHALEVEDSDRLLYLVLSWILAQSIPLGNWLDRILPDNAGLGGDPGWEIVHIDGEGFLVWSDPEVSGLEPHEKIYSEEKVHQALKESLLAFAEAYPDRAKEARETLERYHL